MSRDGVYQTAAEFVEMTDQAEQLVKTEGTYSGSARESTLTLPPPLPCPLDIERLIVDFHVPVFRYAIRLTGVPQDAEELSQQTFLMAQKNLQQVRDPAKVLSWLFAIVRSCYHKSRRKPRPLPASNLKLEIDEIPEIAEDGLIDCEQIQVALAQLPEDYKLVLLAFYFEDCSYKEIAERLQLPTGTVMSRLSRAKSRLRAILLKADLEMSRPLAERLQSDKRQPNLFLTKARSPGDETTSRTP